MARHPQGISGWKNKHEDWNCGTGGEEQVEIGVCLGLSWFVQQVRKNVADGVDDRRKFRSQTSDNMDR